MDGAVPSRWRTRPRGSVPVRSFIPKYCWFPFLVRCIFRPRALLPFLTDDGAETMPPSFSKPSPVRSGDP